MKLPRSSSVLLKPCLALASACLLMIPAQRSHAGTLDHFTWDTVPASATAGTAFATQVTARDSSGNAVTSYSGSVPVTATSGNSPIVITEVQLASPHQVEIQNVSNATVTTTGWFLVFGDSTSSVTSTNASYFYLTTGSTTKQTSQTSTLTAGQMQIVNDSAPTAGDFSHINWSTSTRKGWVALFDSTNTLRDFLVWGWLASDLSGFSITVNSTTITLGSQWSGDGFSGTTSTSGYSMQRTGTADHNTSADWSWVTPTSFGTSTPGTNKPTSTYTSTGTNTGLTLPFTSLGTVSSTGAVSLTLSPTSITLTNGVFSGNLTVSPAATVVTLTANDGSGHTGTSSPFAVAAAPPLAITSTSPLNAGTTGTAYSQTLAATGGTGSYTWSVSSGTLPNSLTLSSAGVLSGTPSVAGTFNFTAQVTDSGSNTATQAFAVTIYAPSNMTISTTSPLTAGYVGTAYSQTFSAASGTTPYTWTLSSGSLPGGLSLSSAGVLSGTPTAAGAFTFTVRVSDSANGTATKALTVEIFLVTSANGIGIPSPIDTTTYTATDPTSGASVQVPAGMVYIPSGAFIYGPSTTSPVVPGASVSLNGYCISRFHVTNAEFLAFITATGYTQYIPSTGVTPTAYWVNGTYPAGTANYPVNFVSLSAAKAYAAWVSQKTGFNVIIPTAYQWEKAARIPNTTNFSLTNVYPWGYTSAGGATYSGGVLTSKFNFNANVTSYYLTTLNTPYSLTPAWTSASTVTFVGGGAVTATTPYYGNPPQYASAPYNYYPSPMTVNSIVSISNASTPVVTKMTISSTGAVSGYVDHNTDTGFIYTDLFAAINNAGGYTTAVGTYPTGVSNYGAYDMAGNLWNWTTTLFTAANGAEAGLNVNEVRGGSWYATASSAVSVDSGEGRADGNYNSVGFRIAMILPTTAANLSVTTTALNEGVISTSYSQTLAATGDTAPYNWSVSSGTLPTGLSFSPAGVLSGTPTATGAFTFTAQVTGSGGQTATQSFTVTIANPLTITSTSPLAGGTVGAAYSQTLAASGGATPYAWSVTSGTLPASLTLSSTGVLSGTPGAAGTYNFTVQVTDNGGITGTQAFSVIIANAPAITSTSPLAGGITGTVYSQTLSASGGTGSLTWSVTSGSLPANLSLTSAGVLSGTPTAAATSNFTVQIADAVGATAIKAFALTVVSPLSITSTSTLANGAAGTSYSQTLTATGGTTPYTWSVAAGSLPSGLSLSSAGVLTGIPTAAGTFSFTANVADSASQAATKTLAITVASAFNNWAASYGLTGANSGMNASYTGDGIANLLKFAFGANPTIPGMAAIQVNNGVVANDHGGPVVEISSNGNFALFGRLDNYVPAGLTYTVQFTADLVTWANSSTTPTVLADDGQIQVVSVPYPALVNGQPARFFRVSVTAP